MRMAESVEEEMDCGMKCDTHFSAISISSFINYSLPYFFMFLLSHIMAHFFIFIPITPELFPQCFMSYGDKRQEMKILKQGDGFQKINLKVENKFFNET